MAALATAAQIRLEGNLPGDATNEIKDARFVPFIDRASIEVQRILTKAVYDALEGQPKTEVTKAENLVALSYAIVPLNMETAGAGITKVKGWDESRSEVLGVSEAKNLAEHFYNQGVALLAPYIPKPEDQDDETSEELDLGAFRMSALVPQ